MKRFVPIDQWINAGTLMGEESADAESWGATDNDFMAGLRNSLDCRDFLVDIPKWNQRFRCGPLDESDRNQGILVNLVTHNEDEGTLYYGIIEIDSQQLLFKD